MIKWCTCLGLVFAFGCRVRVPNQSQWVVLQTPKGEIKIELSNQTPRHKARFLELVAQGYFNGFTFNRVVPGFVIQGGCPDTPQGFAGSPYLEKPEFVDGLHHEYGALGAGRDANPEKMSAVCQFYIVENKKGLPRLDGKYTVFGRVISGMEVVHAIAESPRDSLDQPISPIPIRATTETR
jgi:peptidyl-prolyl cis-trans isomerase B (cyclophilin B)